MNRKQKLSVVGLAVLCAVASPVFADWTTGSVPADGVYKFTFGVENVAECEGFAVPASAVCDLNGTYTDTFSYGFLGTTDTSYLDDVPSNLKAVPHAIDGFNVVKGQKIVLHDGTDSSGNSIVYGPAASEYLPEGASAYEGRYPVRFAARMPERGYYAVTCIVANASSTANADVTLFSERCHTHAQHLTLAPGETKTFSWSVELAPNFFKASGTYNDNAINVVVVGENAALASVTVTKQPTTTENATVNGEAQASINVGKTMWLCDDSTGTDQRCDTPYFALQNYSGVGSGLSRWAPENLSIRNQGEGGLASSDNAHFNTCLLKPGDYLYVEYGHNESSTENFTSNLEKYLTRANTAGAYLIIVSPIERHFTWDSENSQWVRTLQGYAEAGKAWVEAKIAGGATNVAFLDLNERYSTWMNQEIVRINGINSAISLEKAIDFYYMSAKGGSVDKAHPNNAGADVGAYCVWQEALAVVAAGENAEEGTSAKIQANVVSGIIDGVAAKVAGDTPWYADNATIAAGAAPNALWDYAVRAGYDYINSAAVAAVDATVENGVATISGISMRVLNQINYAKAVIDIVSEDEATTNRWYSYYNYDASGSTSGGIVVPEAAGFIDTDLDKDTEPGAHYSATLAVPAGAKALIHFAEADGGTWQVGDNPAISAVYPFEAWTQVLLDDDCSDVATWTSLFGGVKTFASDDGHITFSMTGYDDAGTRKKSGGFAKAFADSASVSTGRIRVSFKALYTHGALRFALSNSKGTTTSPMEGGDICATLNGAAAVFGSAANVTLSADSTPVPQTTVNADEWMDVDMIIDLDAGKATASIGGSDYKAYSIGTPSKTPWSYFGVTLESTKAHAGAIDDVKIVALAPSPASTISANVNDSAYGHVEINGVATDSANIFKYSDAVLTAVSEDQDLYKFVRWEDANGNEISTKAALYLADVTAPASYTAVFAEYARDENRVLTWDFAGYQGDFEVAASAATTVHDNGMTFSLQPSDKITSDGIYWQNAATGAVIKKEDVLSASDDHYIVYTPKTSGTLSMKFSVDNYASNRKPIMCIKAASSADECKNSNGDATLTVYAKDTEYTLSDNLTAGTTYYIWAYSYNWSAGGFQHNYTIPSITYTYAPVYYTATAAVAEGQEEFGTASVSASEVIFGKSVTFTATPVSIAYAFVNWTDAEGNEVSTSATYTTAVTADLALTANFAATGLTVDTHSFVWNWNVAEGEWNNPANWYYANSTIQAETYPSDAESDYATFTTAATVTLTGDAAVKEAWFNADVTLANGTLTAQLLTGWGDEIGELTLDDVSISNVSGNALVISNNLVIAGAATNTISHTGANLFLEGGLKGTGVIRLLTGDNNYHGPKLRGNNLNFAGEVIFSGASGRRYQQWNSSSATSSNAFWRVETGAPTSVRNADGDCVSDSGTYYFGGYTGTWWKQNYAYNYNLEIGALSKDSDITINTGVAGRNPSVTKVGTANLTLGTTCIKDLTIEGGSVTMPIGIAPQTLTMAEGASIMIGGDAAWAVGTKTNLFSYGSYVDHGAGELARQVTVTGLADGLEAEISIDGTTVTATIVASAPTTPTTDDEGAVIVKDAETGAYTITTEAETLAITVPEGVTVGEVVVSPATTTVTGVPEGAKVSVMLEGEKYEIVKLVDSAVELDGTKSAVVEGEAIPVTPTLTESGDEEAAPLAVDAASVAVGVKAIPGLTYRLVRGSSPTEIATPAAEEKATGRRVSLEDKQPPHGSAFYRIHVGLK